MSNSKGYYFTSDSTDCNGDGCDWDIDHEQILCDYFGVVVKRNVSLHKLLHGDKLIYRGWIPHLCFNSEITISKNQLSSKSEYLKFKIVNFRK